MLSDIKSIQKRNEITKGWMFMLKKTLIYAIKNVKYG